MAKVEFFANGSKLDEDTTQPYSFTWSNAAIGSYNLTAVATDNDNATTTSAAVNIKVQSADDVFTVDFASQDLYFETENYASTGDDWSEIFAGNASGGAFMENDPDAQDEDSDAFLTYTLNVSNGGEINVWILGQGPNGSSNSVKVKIDDDSETVFHLSKSGWTWKQNNLTINNGTVTLTILNREPSAQIDRVFLTKGDAEPDLFPAPDGLTAAAISDSQINLTWDDNSSDEDGFKIERRKAGDDNFIEVGQTKANDDSYNDPDLDKNTTYIYRIKVFKDGIDSGFSNESSATTWGLTIIYPNEATDELTVGQEVILEWTWNGEIADVALEWRTQDNDTYTTIAANTSNNGSYNWTPSVAAAQVKIRIRDINSDIRDWSNNYFPVVDNMRSVPLGPDDLTVEATGTSSIDLSWNDNSDNEDEFEIERSSDGSSSNWTRIATVGVDNESYSNTGLSSSTIYYYRIRARNTAGPSDYSNIENAITNDENNGGVFTVDFASEDLYFETEDYASIGDHWTKISDGNVSGGAFMENDPDAENEDSDAYLTYTLNVSNSGTVNVWILGQGPDGSSNSVKVKIDDESETTFSLSESGWNWKRKELTINNGTVTFTILNREPGAQIDRVFLTKGNTEPDQDNGVGSITVDGNTSDWSDISALTTASGQNLTSLKVTSDATKLYFLLEGNNIDKHTSIFINSDNKSSTGYQYEGWTSSGVDYLIEDDELYKSTDNNSGWNWSFQRTSAIDRVKISSVVEVSIEKSALSELNNTITIGAWDSNSDWDEQSLLPTSGALPSYSGALAKNILLSSQAWEDVTTESPATLSLSQNHPNPFNPTTIIRYALPQQSHVTLQVFDLLGREIATLVNQALPAGRYQAHWNASDVKSGIYFYRLQAGGTVQVRRLMLVK